MQISQPRHQSLNILYTNCRSLYNKLDDLRCLTLQHLPHIICLCETWLDDTILDNELLIPSFVLVRRDRNRNGGGVAIYIHESIPFKIISKHERIELLIIHLSLASNPLTCLFYRPPSSNTSVLHDLEEALDVLPPSKTSNILVLGDFNIDAAPNMNNSVLSSIQAKHDLCQIISHPTRQTKSTSSTIDHVYLSNPLSQTSTLSPLSTSDHCCILLTLSNVKPPHVKPTKRRVWIYQQADFDLANDKLAELSINETQPVDSVWTDWYAHFMSTMTEAIPSKLVKPSNNLPYLTSDLLKLIRMKHRLFKHACAAATDLAWSKYKTIRNHVTSALKTARCRFFNSLSSKLNSLSDFWKSFHKLSPKKTRIPVDLSLGNESSSTSPSSLHLLLPSLLCIALLTPHS